MWWFYTGEVACVGITRHRPVMGKARHEGGHMPRLLMKEWVTDNK